MDKMTYEERVRQIAEEMAQKYYKEKMEPVSGGVYKREFMYARWGDIAKTYKEELIDFRSADAHIAVAAMAESFIESYCIWVRAEENMTEYDNERINYALIERGLIPDKTETK